MMSISACDFYVESVLNIQHTVVPNFSKSLVHCYVQSDWCMYILFIAPL